MKLVTAYKTAKPDIMIFILPKPCAMTVYYADTYQYHEATATYSIISVAATNSTANDMTAITTAILHCAECNNSFSTTKVATPAASIAYTGIV